jgi:hypothetical protein
VRPMEATDAHVQDARFEALTVVGRHGDAPRGDLGQGAVAQRDGGRPAVAPHNEHDKHKDINMTSMDSC